MKKQFTILMLITLCGLASFAQQAGDYRSRASGDWEDYLTWEFYDGVNWDTAYAAPAASAIVDVFHQVTISSDALANHVNVYGSLMIDTNATLTIGNADAGYLEIELWGTAHIKGTVTCNQDGTVYVAEWATCWWDEGTIEGNIEVDVNGYLRMNDSYQFYSQLHLVGDIELYGTMYVNSGTHLILSHESQLRIHHFGTMNCSSQFNNIIIEPENGPDLTIGIVNDGKIIKNGGDHLFLDVNLDCQDTLLVGGGKINLGSVDLPVNALFSGRVESYNDPFGINYGLEMKVGEFIFAATSDVSGSIKAKEEAYVLLGGNTFNQMDMVNLCIDDSAVVEMEGEETVYSLNMLGGTLTGSTKMVVFNSFTWQQGLVDDSTEVEIDQQCNANFNLGNARLEGSLFNYGHIYQTVGELQIGATATIENYNWIHFNPQFPVVTGWSGIMPDPEAPPMVLPPYGIFEDHGYLEKTGGGTACIRMSSIEKDDYLHVDNGILELSFPTFNSFSGVIEIEFWGELKGDLSMNYYGPAVINEGYITLENLKMLGDDPFLPQHIDGMFSVGHINTLTIDADANVTVIGSIKIDEKLHLKKGKLNTENGTLKLENFVAASLEIDPANVNLDQSWIVGPFQRMIAQNNVDYIFPVGNNAHASPLVMNPINIFGMGQMVKCEYIPKPGTDVGLFVLEDNYSYQSICNDVWKLTSPDVFIWWSYDLSLSLNGYEATLTDNRFGLLKRIEPSADAADWYIPFGSSLPAEFTFGRMIAGDYAVRNDVIGEGQFGIGRFVQMITSYPDVDGDLWGDLLTGTTDIVIPPGNVLTPGDCNDLWMKTECL